MAECRNSRDGKNRHREVGVLAARHRDEVGTHRKLAHVVFLVPEGPQKQRLCRDDEEIGVAALDADPAIAQRLDAVIGFGGDR